MRLGIDLGGTKIEIIALDEAGETLHRERIATPKRQYRETLEAIAGLVEMAERKLEEQGSLGICTPGAISPHTGLLKNSNSVCLNGQPFLSDLEQRLERPIAIANDANCLALSEATDGAAQGAAVVFGVIVGTGTGGGIVIDGKVLSGVNAIGGEWGHNPLPWPQPEELPGMDCYCGKQGCIETWISGTGFARQFAAQYGEKLSAEQIVVRAETGDQAAMLAFDSYVDRMARGLAHVINIVDPDVIVLGGGMSNVKALYERVPQRWSDYVFSDHVATRLAPPMYGDSSGVRGAAWLGKRSRTNP